MELIMGDEFTPGANRRSSGLRSVSPTLTKAFGDRTVVSAVHGASLTGKGKLNFAHLIKQFSFAAYDRVLLFYGVSDYFHSRADLGVISRKLTADLHEIRRQNQWLRVYGILPFPMYDRHGKGLSAHRGPGYYTLHDLIEMLSVTYANNQVPALNWALLANPVINQHNAAKRLKSGKYPTAATSRLMGDRIAAFVKAKDRSYHPDQMLHNRPSQHVSISFSNPPRPQSNSASDVQVKSNRSKK